MRGTATGLLGAGAALFVLALGGCATAAPRVVDLPGAVAAEHPLAAPPDPVASVRPARGGNDTPFGQDEEVIKDRGKRLKGGIVEHTAYLYSPDYRYALVASRPGQGPTMLGWEARDWFIHCASGAAACELRLAGPNRRDAPQEDALRIRFDPAGPAYTVCVGPDGASDGALRVGGSGTWRYTGRKAGCFDADDSRRIVDELAAGDSFNYRYQRADGGDEARGWYPVFGLRPALRLAGWMAARIGA